MRGAGLTEHSPYRRSLRRLHLAVALCVLALAATGFAIYFRKPLGIQAWKMNLVVAHATIAYVFLAVLTVRIYLGVIGAEEVRLKHTMPRLRDLRRLCALKGDRTRWKFGGRSPLSRTLAGLLYAAFAINAATGLVRAGTDLYWPPFGPFVREYVAAEGANPQLVKPGYREHVDAARFAAVSRGKIPIGRIHIFGAFFIAGIALLHAAGAAIGEWSAPHDRRARGRARLMLFGPSPKR